MSSTYGIRDWPPRILAASWLAVVLGVAIVSGSTVLGAFGYGPTASAGYEDSFTVSCGTSATLIQSPHGQVGYRAFVDDAAGVDVYFGDSAVTTSIGEPAGAGEKVGSGARKAYCIVAATPTTVRVRALVATDPASFVGGAVYWINSALWPEMIAARIEG